MHELFEHYEERLTRRQAKDSTLRNLRRTAALFEQSGLNPTTAKDWEIEEWLASLELSQRTKRLHFENLNAVYRYGQHRGLVTLSPMDFVKLAREPDTEPHILTNDELRLILRQARTNQDVLLANLLIYTGMRRSEIRMLAWHDIKLRERTITVRAGKGDKLRHVPIHPELMDVLVECDNSRWDDYVIQGPHGPLAENSMFYRLESFRGSIECSYHDFRRTVATSLAENDVPDRLIDKILGWAPRTVRERHYVRNADSKLQRAILCLYADDPL